VPDACDHGRAVIIHPSIDPFSPKNADMDPRVARAILNHVGIIGGPDPEDTPAFTRLDGSPGRVDHMADVTGLGRRPGWDDPLVVQVSRWDPLKDPIGVMHGFVQYLQESAHDTVQLVLAGPTVRSIADDPEGVETLERVLDYWRRLPHSLRARIHLVCLPMADVEENGAIVNALQRHATVIVQKSTHEGFGLTVTEAMWKGRPVLASAVGGIVDQITDGENGLLLRDPTDPAAFADALRRLIDDPELSRRLGNRARETVREEFLPVRHLLKYADLLARLDLQLAARP
jgi:trehalose synthase